MRRRLERGTIVAIVTIITVALAACAQPDLAGQRYAVYFQEGSANLDAAAKDSISIAAAWAVDHPTAVVRVIGYADPEGSSEANLAISLARAQSVVAQLTALGVPRDNIKVAGRGEVQYSLDPQESRRVLIALSKP